MTDEFDYHKNKLPGKTYISRRIVTTFGDHLRQASKVLDKDEDFLYAKEKDELVIRHTPGGRKEIVAKFFEDSRHMEVVTIQSFNPEKGTPHKTHFSFIGQEIAQLVEFFGNISSITFRDEARVNISDHELKSFILSKDQARNLVHDNQDLFSELLRSEVTKEDVVALGYRKKQLDVFGRLLADSVYFENIKNQKSCRGDEDLWQKFFERNQWIFGYGLHYVFVTGFEDRKLEQIVQGSDLLNRGKRADALMMTRGIVNSLCFTEIKTHRTPLLEKASYRPGCWAPSRELAGAVAQVQGTVASAMRNLSDRIRPCAADGTPTGEEVFNYKPRAFVVIGNLCEFVGEHGVNAEKLRSFELYRNSIVGMEIITFDELHERTKFIVEAAAT
jgi:hypothetical protein